MGNTKAKAEDEVRRKRRSKGMWRGGGGEKRRIRKVKTDLNSLERHFLRLKEARLSQR